MTGSTPPRIYTKKGDDGSTSLLGGNRVKKYHVRLETYGTLDELNSQLGVVHSFLIDVPNVEDLKLEIPLIQNVLFNIGSELAAVDESWKTKIPHVKKEDILRLEGHIDLWTTQLPPLKNFILPGGHKAASFLHVARAVTRRAERLAVHAGEEFTVDPLILSFLNRLSDFLFVASRILNHRAGILDVEWKKE